MIPPVEQYRDQSGHNRHFYGWLHEARPNDANDWKVTALFYSALHSINYELAKRTGRAPKSHAERNRRIRRELPRVRKDYADLYAMSLRARYCDGYRLGDDRRRAAVELADRIQADISP